MKIWESERDLGGIMRKLIIIIEIAIIVLLLAATPGEQAKGIKEAEGINIEGKKYFLMTATAYYPGPECTAPYDDGYTAIGHVAGRGSIAIDPVNGPLKFNQKVYIEGYGYGICNDVGAAIKGWKIDLCLDTLEEAKEYGVKLVKVYVLD